MQSSGSELKLDVHARARNGASSRAKGERDGEGDDAYRCGEGRRREGKEKHVRNSEARRKKGEGSRWAKQDEEASKKRKEKACRLRAPHGE